MARGLHQRFQIQGCVAKSRMAVVHLAFDPENERHIALKRQRPDLRDDPLITSLFRHEQRLAETFSHPHIPQALETGVMDGDAYIAFEYVQGHRLVDLLTQINQDRRFVAISQVWAIARGVASALAYLHRPGLNESFPSGVHMDVCPHNILLRENGDPLLIDFGISRSAWLAPDVPVVLGREAYVAPELFRGASPTPALDVFALGVLLHEALLAKPLFRAADRAQTFARIQHAPISVPHLERSSCPPELGSIVLRALARDPQRRFADGGEILSALSAHM
ncbi:MAG: serine/threonine protein kinase [Deltaproteobacteria bacterium]|nr:serine/threonine protein kinase [Deltaproteobacteria bacterium]